MLAGKIHKVLLSVSAITNVVSVASTLSMLLLLRKDMHFYFLMEVRRLLIIFQVGCAVAAAGAYATDNTSTVAERGAGYCFLIPPVGPSHCDASDVNCCCCTWVLLFMPFSLLCFGYGW